MMRNTRLPARKPLTIAFIVILCTTCFLSGLVAANDPKWRQPGRCGTNCLYVLLKLLRYDVTYDKIAESVPSDPRKGCSADDLVSAGRTFGATLEARQVGKEDFINLPTPYIIHLDLVDLGGSGHFAVVTDFLFAEGKKEPKYTSIEMIDGTSGKLLLGAMENILPAATGYVVVPVKSDSILTQNNFSSTILVIACGVLIAIPIAGICFFRRPKKTAPVTPPTGSQA